MSAPDEKVPPDVLFNAHVDACDRCRWQPFNLCSIGNRLLRECGAQLVAEYVETKHLQKQARRAGPQ